MKEINKSGFISDVSFAKTNTYDLVLEVCPEVLLGKKEAGRAKDWIKKHNKKIEGEKKKGDYSAKYKNLKLKFKSKLLQEFFDRDNYVLAFDDGLPKGWVKWGMFPLLANRIGRKYLKFAISDEVAEKSFVLEQKYWSPLWSKKKFGVNSWKPGFEIWEYPKIVREVFGKYYLSIERLSDYKKGQFEVPEFWIYGKVGVRDCEGGEMDKGVYDRLLKKREKLRGLE
tara:strand:+ start:465 stop:1142 length:678 start_codon:yes stop_codon:yes gene_type:complete